MLHFLLIVSWFFTLAKMWGGMSTVNICERNSINIFLLDSITIL